MAGQTIEIEVIGKDGISKPFRTMASTLGATVQGMASKATADLAKMERPLSLKADTAGMVNSIAGAVTSSAVKLSTLKTPVHLQAATSGLVDATNAAVNHGKDALSKLEVPVHMVANVGGIVDAASHAATQGKDSLAKLETPIHPKADTTGLLSSIRGAVDSAMGMLGKIGLAGLGVGAIAGVAGSAKDLLGGLLGGPGEMERYETQFGVLLGGADNAKERLAELVEYAKTTPFELPGVIKADKILQGFGLHADETAEKFGYSGTDIRTIAGDVAAGAGTAFEEMTLYLGKFAAGATGEALERFAELGITTREQLKGMGVQFSKSGELMSPLPVAMNALLTQMKGKYGGMMAAQAETMEGMGSNLSDWIGQTKVKLTQPIFDALKPQMGNLLSWLSSPEVTGALDGLADGIAGAVATAGDWLGQLGGWIDKVKGWIATFQGYLSAGNKFDLMRAIGLPPDIAYRVDELVRVVKTNFATVQQIIKNFGDVLSGETTLVDWLSNSAGKLGDVFGSYYNKLGELLATVMPLIIDQVQKWTKAFIDWIGPMIPPFFAELGRLGGLLGTWLEERIPEIVEQLKKWGRQFVEWVSPYIPPLLTELSKLWEGAKNWMLTVALPAIIEQLAKWGLAFQAWVGPAALDLLGELSKLGLKVQGWIKDVAIPTIGAKMLDLGKAMVAGIIKGLGDLAGTLGKIVGDAAGAALQAAKDRLGIFSPSREFEKVGKAIVDGMTMGITQGQGGLFGTIDSMIKQAITRAKGPTNAAISQWAIGVGMPEWVGREFADEFGRLPGTLEEFQDFLAKHGWSGSNMPKVNPADLTKTTRQVLTEMFGGLSDVGGQLGGALASTVGAFQSVIDRVKESGGFTGAAEGAMSRLQEWLKEVTVGQQLAQAASAMTGLGLSLPPELLALLGGMRRTGGGYLDTVIKSLLGQGTGGLALTAGGGATGSLPLVSATGNVGSGQRLLTRLAPETEDSLAEKFAVKVARELAKHPMQINFTNAPEAVQSSWTIASALAGV